jgi:cytochrome c2
MVKKLIVAGVMIPTSSVPGMAQDAQKGATVFDVCKVCHAIGPGRAKQDRP